MVKVQDFAGAVFHPQNYQKMLSNNIQHLETVPMSKTFNSHHFISNGQLFKEKEPFFYIYRQIYLGHTSYGIVAEISLEDYDQNKIKRHEKTLVREGLNHQTYMKDHVGPVVVSHRKDQALSVLTLKLAQANQIFAEWNTVDGRSHALWKIKKSELDFEDKFASIESLYILDGHHRFEAAHQNYILHTGNPARVQWIQAIIYSSEYVVIHPQHRVLLNTPSTVDFIDELFQISDLEITEIAEEPNIIIDITLELTSYEVILKYHQKLYGINFKSLSRNVLEQISTFRLQEQIFSEILDQEGFKKLKYVPGIIQQGKIYEHQVVFFVREPEIEIIFQLADENVTMPPKSTWIEPKPCSHMVIRLF